MCRNLGLENGGADLKVGSWWDCLVWLRRYRYRLLDQKKVRLWAVKRGKVGIVNGQIDNSFWHKVNL